MMTWTINDFKGHYPVGTAAIVTADSLEIAIKLLEDALSARGLTQEIKPEQLVPIVTTTRKVRILCDGDY